MSTYHLEDEKEQEQKRKLYAILSKLFCSLTLTSILFIAAPSTLIHRRCFDVCVFSTNARFLVKSISFRFNHFCHYILLYYQPEGFFVTTGGFAFCATESSNFVLNSASVIWSSPSPNLTLFVHSIT